MRQEGPGYQKSINEMSQVLMTFNCHRTKQHQGDLNRTCQADSRDFRIHKLGKTVAGGEGKKKYPARQCKICLHIRSAVKLNTFVNSVFYCCTHSLVLRNTGCPTRYRTWHFFNNPNTNEDIAGVHSLCEK